MDGAIWGMDRAGFAHGLGGRKADSTAHHLRHLVASGSQGIEKTSAF